MQHLSETEKQEIRQAIREQEVHTTGEIVTVIARASDHYLYVPTLWAAILALITPFALHLIHYQFHFLNSYPLIHFSKHLHISVYQMQLIVFCLFALMFRWPWLKMKLIPKTIKHSRASRLAHEQFYAQGLHHKAERTGLLIFVSLAEQYVEVLADKHINDAVSENSWNELINTFIRNVKTQNVKNGYLLAIQQAGVVLRQHFPCTPERDINELPDHLIEI
jgi:putative membrane protein